MPITAMAFSTIASSRRAPCAAMDTWSSWLAEVGIESDAGRVGALLVFRDERRRRDLRDHEPRVQPRLRREEGRQAGQRRVHQHGDAPLGERTDLAHGQAIMSAANATGSAWKLPPESASSVSGKISGLSETPFASVASSDAAWRSTSSTAPITWGWQRRQ